MKIATRPVDTGSTAPPTVHASLAYCDALARNAGANFYWGFHLLASEERLAMSALYAFARTTDDIVDEGTSSIAERDVQLERWRGELLAALNGASSSSRILIAVADCARRFQLPVDELLALVDGCAQDLRKTRYETMDETLDYCRKVAGTVGLNMLAILGAEHPVAERAMLDLATAFQLTNILRDVPEDARRDRIYLPLDELKTHGVTEHDVLSGGSDALRRYMRQVGAQAKDRYRLSGAMSPHLTPRAANALTVMRCIYEGILDQILWRDCDVWSRRPKLSALRKARILLPVLFNSGLGNLISFSDFSMPKNDIAGSALDTMERVAGCLPGYRRAHSRGLALLGNFRASPLAAELSCAGHFQGGEVPCLVRVSNSEGRPFAPDRVAAGQGRVMGFAIRFSLPEGKFATWAGINVPAFPARTPEEFIGLTAAQKRGRNGKPNRARLVWHLIRHLHILAAVKRIQALPLCESLALENYYGIHTYFLVDAAGRRRPFRYQWLAAQKPSVGDDAPRLGEDLYLMDEIRRRLARGPLAWDLVAQIPAAGDDLLNASRAWPDDREKILLGRLTLDRVHPNQAETELVVFDPTGVVPGLEISDDPILKFRPVTYALSYARREKENRTAPAPADMGQ